MVAEALDRPSSERVRAWGKPLVLASHYLEGIALPIAVPDDYGGVRAAVEHLLDHGHTRVGFGDLRQHDYRERRAAWLLTLADALDRHAVSA